MKLVDAKHQVRQFGVKRWVIVVILDVSQDAFLQASVFQTRQATRVFNNPVVHINGMLSIEIKRQVGHVLSDPSAV